MPRNLSAWIDLTIHLLIMLILIGVLSYYNLYIAAIAGLVLWETGTILRKMEQQKVSRRNGIIGIGLMALATLTAAAFFVIGAGKWIFYLSFALFFVGSIITTGNEDEPSVTQ